MPVTKDAIHAGQSVYTPIMLRLYDFVVLFCSNRFIWRCSTPTIQQWFSQHVKQNHLDIGVGSGYYLQHHRWATDSCVSICDLNTDALAYTKKRIHPVRVSNTLHADIYQQQDKYNGCFDSISINYLLHCLPGSMHDKSDAIKHAVLMLKQGGTLFGSTILGERNKHTRQGRQLMAFYQKKTIFSNQQDTLASLTRVLNDHLENVEIQVVGAVALFKGDRGPLLTS